MDLGKISESSEFTGMADQPDALPLAAYPWTGLPYKVEINGGASLLTWANKAVAYFLGRQLTFGVDGSVSIEAFGRDGRPIHKNTRPLTIPGNKALSWKWDALDGRLLIHWMDARGGVALGWRWDELEPDGDVSSLICKWHGTAHVGPTTFSYTLCLKDSPQLQRGTLGESLIVAHGSFISDGSFAVSPDISPLEEDIIKKIVSRYGDFMGNDKSRIDSTLEIIDRMWLQELVLQCQAEILTVVIGGIAQVEQGANPHELFEHTLAGVHNVRDVAFDSLKVRSEARAEVALAGGLEGIHRTLAAKLDEAETGVKPLVDKLVEPSQVADARKDAEQMLSAVVAEFEAISSLKEAHSETFMQLQDDLDALQHGERTFIETVLRAARANPQNASLQKACIEALIFRERNGNLDDCIELIVEAMEAHGRCRRVLETCCKAVVHLVEHFPSVTQQLGQKGFVERLLKIVTEYAQDAAIQMAAFSALLGLVDCSDDNQTTATFHGAVQTIQEAIEKHEANCEIQKKGLVLLDILVPLQGKV